MQFHYMTNMATPQHKNPCPRGQEIYNFGRHFLGHHYYILSLSDVCLGDERKIFKEIMHFYYMTYMVTPQNLTPGVMKFTILVDPSLFIITTYLVFLINTWEQRRRCFKKYSNFTLFTPKLPLFPQLGVIQFTISCLLTLQMLHIKFG